MVTSEIREQFLARFVQISLAIQFRKGVVHEDNLCQESSYPTFRCYNYVTSFSINPSFKEGL